MDWKQSTGGASQGAPLQDVSFCDLARANRDLEKIADELMGMTDELADARTVENFTSERMKNALAKGQVKSGCKSAAQSEVVARCDATYLAEAEQIQADYRVAQRSIVRHKNLCIKHDALRTKISAQKEAMGLR